MEADTYGNVIKFKFAFAAQMNIIMCHYQKCNGKTRWFWKIGTAGAVNEVAVIETNQNLFIDFTYFSMVLNILKKTCKWKIKINLFFFSKNESLYLCSVLLRGKKIDESMSYLNLYTSFIIELNVNIFTKILNMLVAIEKLSQNIYKSTYKNKYFFLPNKIRTNKNRFGKIEYKLQMIWILLNVLIHKSRTYTQIYNECKNDTIYKWLMEYIFLLNPPKCQHIEAKLMETKLYSKTLSEWCDVFAVCVNDSEEVLRTLKFNYFDFVFFFY